MPIVSANEARANLLGKGFRQREGKKHTFFDLYVNDKNTGINTHFSRGKKSHSDIDEGLMDLMKYQLKLDRWRQVFELLNCDMTGGEYLQILKDRGKLAPPTPI